jgi:hypothetical protein
MIGMNQHLPLPAPGCALQCAASRACFAAAAAAAAAVRQPVLSSHPQAVRRQVWLPQLLCYSSDMRLVLLQHIGRGSAGQHRAWSARVDM